jgi:hypothetical protein
VPVEKKESGKFRVCIDFRNLNRETPKDEYPMPIADMLINNASGNRIIIFVDGNARYNQYLYGLVKNKISNHPKHGHKILSEALWAHRISKHHATSRKQCCL